MRRIGSKQEAAPKTASAVSTLGGYFEGGILSACEICARVLARFSRSIYVLLAMSVFAICNPARTIFYVFSLTI